MSGRAAAPASRSPTAAVVKQRLVPAGQPRRSLGAAPHPKLHELISWRLAVGLPRRDRGDLRGCRDRFRARAAPQMDAYDGQDEHRVGTDADCRIHERSAPSRVSVPRRSDLPSGLTVTQSGSRGAAARVATMGGVGARGRLWLVARLWRPPRAEQRLGWPAALALSGEGPAQAVAPGGGLAAEASPRALYPFGF